jgi:sugar-specific transcriptional regulator TrmB
MVQKYTNTYKPEKLSREMDRVEFFINLGMNEYEAKTLAGFSKLGKASPKEISISSGVPQNKLYSIIKKFISLGLVAEIPNEPKKYQLINLGSFVKEKLDERKKNLRELEKNSKNIHYLDVGGKFNFSIIMGQRAVMNKIAEINKEVHREILGVQRNWKFWGEGIRAMEASIKKGVEVKQIGVINSETEKRAGEWKKIGVSVRAYNKKFGEFPLRFSVFDSKYARITIGKPEISKPEDYITIWTDSKPLVAMLRNQFMQMWKESERF